MKRNSKIPIEYYGINPEAKGIEFNIEREFIIKEKIEEIIRVYGEINKKKINVGVDIVGEKNIYILLRLSLTIEYITDKEDKELNVKTYDIPVYCYLKEDKDTRNIKANIGSLYINNYNKERIYIYSTIKVY